MRTVIIGLLGHAFGHANLGVDALSRSNLQLIRNAAQDCGVSVQFVVFGQKEDISGFECVAGGPKASIKHALAGNLSYWRALRRCDLVMDISAGDSFTDIYGHRRFVEQAYAKVMAILSGSKLILSPQTIGPFSSDATRNIAARILRRSAHIFTRDALSTRAVYALASELLVSEVTDVAFCLPYERMKNRSSKAVAVGINVSGLLYRQGAGFGLTLDYPAFIRRLITQLGEREGREIYLIPHVLADGADDDDVAVARSLSIDYPFVHVPPTFNNAVDAKSFISGLDVLVGSRMHACIAAFSSGVPVVPVSYSRKFEGLFGTLGYRNLVDARMTGTEAAVGRILDWLDGIDGLRCSTLTALTEADTRLRKYQEELTSLIAGTVRSARQTYQKGAFMPFA